MAPFKKPLAVLLIVVTLVAFNLPAHVAAHLSAWYLPAQVIQSLTKGTPDDLNDDNGIDFVHQIQWVNTPWTEVGWRTDVDTNFGNGNGTIEVAEVFAWLKGRIGNTTGPNWANPEQTLNLASGAIQDRAFLLASLLKFHTDQVKIAEGDKVYVLCACLVPLDIAVASVLWYDASAGTLHVLDVATGQLTAPPPQFPFGAALLNDEAVIGYLPGYYPGPLNEMPGYDRHDFARIAAGGFGDPMNNYAWSMANFNDQIYVGTGRNIPYMLGVVLKQAGILPPDFEFEPVTHPRNPNEPYQSQEWAEDMRAEIWRQGSWEQVYQSQAVAWPGGSSPEQYGFREMVEFQGQLYASSGGSPVPGTLMLTSADGQTWQPVATPPEMGTDSRAMIVHNGKLYIATTYNSLAEVWAFDGVNPWQRVADFTAVDAGNTATTSLGSFNGYLYAGTANVVTGYQVFRSDAQDPQFNNWTRIVRYGAGDMMNYFAGTMQVFGGRLYVGSMSLPIEDQGQQPVVVPAKGFELIRINADDTWELVIGDYASLLLPPGGELFRVPRSGWPGGFGNPLNFYCWSMGVGTETVDQVGNGPDVLYLGTFDATSFFQFITAEELFELAQMTPEQQEEFRQLIIQGLLVAIPLMEASGVDDYYIQPFRDLLAVLQTEPVNWEEAWDLFRHVFAGADLWKSNDGLRWEPVTLNGFRNPDNYGFREILQVNPLYVGTANPFEGLEVFRAPPPAPPAGNATNKVGSFKDVFQTDEFVYGIGAGFPAYANIDVYITPDLKWTDEMPIPPDVSSDGMNTVAVGADGTLPPTQFWPPPLVVGEYDIVFDANQNGFYDVLDDYVDNPNHPGFIVEQGAPPAVPTASQWGVVGMSALLALVLAWSVGRRVARSRRSRG